MRGAGGGRAAHTATTGAPGGRAGGGAAGTGSYAPARAARPQPGFLVEICDERSCSRDVYRLDDLPVPLRSIVVGHPQPRVEWTSPDGCRWTVDRAFL